MVTGATTPKLDEFRRRYDLRDSVKQISGSESKMITPADGLRFLQEAPVSDVDFGHPPKQSDSQGCNTYLWVIDGRGVPYLLEISMSMLGDNPPKHTNLTGGKQAYLGGQLWFAGPCRMYVSGGSGRFPPLDEEQLTAAIDVFSSFKYKVISLGWDSESGARRHIQEPSI